MPQNPRIILFLVILAVNIAGGFSGIPALEFISKPLIVISLAGYFYYETRRSNLPLKKWIYLALFFSWTGDVLLMFQQDSSFFFLAGLSAFLIAHIFYIVFFHRVRITEKVRSNLWLLLIVVIYYAGLIAFLTPWLGDMKLPVQVYGLVISFMFMLAMHLLFIRNKKAGSLMMIGALLFVVSDSALAINKFYRPFEWAGLIIMLTYGIAQLFITAGGARYITSADKG